MVVPVARAFYMRRRTLEIDKRYFLLLPLAIVTILFLIYVAPTDLFRIVVFIFLLSSLLGVTVSFFAPKKYQALCFLFVASFLLLNYLVGFTLVNNLLLLSLFLGLTFLIR